MNNLRPIGNDSNQPISLNISDKSKRVITNLIAHEKSTLPLYVSVSSMEEWEKLALKVHFIPITREQTEKLKRHSFFEDYLKVIILSPEKERVFYYQKFDSTRSFLTKELLKVKKPGKSFINTELKAIDVKKQDLDNTDAAFVVIVKLMDKMLKARSTPKQTKKLIKKTKQIEDTLVALRLRPPPPSLPRPHNGQVHLAPSFKPKPPKPPGPRRAPPPGPSANVPVSSTIKPRLPPRRPQPPPRKPQETPNFQNGSRRPPPRTLKAPDSSRSKATPPSPPSRSPSKPPGPSSAVASGSRSQRPQPPKPPGSKNAVQSAHPKPERGSRRPPPGTIKK